jgi:hypothetical protein
VVGVCVCAECAPTPFQCNQPPVVSSTSATTLLSNHSRSSFSSVLSITLLL